MNEFENSDPLKLLKLQAQEDVGPLFAKANRKATVVYHANCMDGFTAAWAFHKLVEVGTPEAYPGGINYIPMSYGDVQGAINIPDYRDCDDLFILDFSFSRYELMFWAPFFRKIVLLDHHKTALEILGHDVWPNEHWPKNLDMVLDMNRSGASITWDWFADVGGLDPETPRDNLINYIEDRDLWKFALPYSKEISAYIQMQERTFISWNILNEKLTWEFKEVADIGKLLLQQREKLVKEIAAKPRKMEIKLPDQGAIFAQCVNCSPGFASEVGNYLVTHYCQIGVTYHQDETGATKFSLRSSNELEDVAKIAEAFGGGGHRNAAGFVMKDPEEKEEIVLYAGREQPEEGE